METFRHSSHPTNKFSLLSTGFLFMAALDDHAEAFMMLSRRYEHQFGGIGKDIEVAAVFAMFASVVASDSFHKIGGQPVLEVTPVPPSVPSISPDNALFQRAIDSTTRLRNRSDSSSSLSIIALILPQVMVGNAGADDEYIQTLTIQADEVQLPLSPVSPLSL
jgi:hypothetical protein